jgi:hypothetical protein
VSAKSRRKGIAFERRVANLFYAAGFDAKRCLTETRDGNSGDIEIDAPLTIQCKCYEKQVPWRRALDEAKVVADKHHHYAVAVTKVNNAEPVAHLSLEDFAEICMMLRKCGAW